jgi:hypothetical protein
MTGEKYEQSQALNELGDLLAHTGNLKDASAAWNDALDLVCGSYQVCFTNIAFAMWCLLRHHSTKRGITLLTVCQLHCILEIRYPKAMSCYCFFGTVRVSSRKSLLLSCVSVAVHSKFRAQMSTAKNLYAVCDKIVWCTSISVETKRSKHSHDVLLYTSCTMAPYHARHGDALDEVWTLFTYPDIFVKALPKVR